MCLMLYLGSRKPLPLRRSEYLSIEPVSKAAEVVRDHVRREYVYFAGSYSGCSCGFPSVVAESAIDYFEGVFDDTSADREKDLASVRELMTVIDEALGGQPDCVLFPVWNGSEGAAPKGDVRWDRNTMSTERFLLTEQFRYTIVREPLSDSDHDPAESIAGSADAIGHEHCTTIEGGNEHCAVSTTRRRALDSRSDQIATLSRK